MFVIITRRRPAFALRATCRPLRAVSWASPDRKFAARAVDRLYSEGDSPLRYKINRPRRAQQQEKWILQVRALHELTVDLADWKAIQQRGSPARECNVFRVVRDSCVLQRRLGARPLGEERATWSRGRSRLKAMLRVCAVSLGRTRTRSTGASSDGKKRLAPWSDSRGCSDRGVLRAFSGQGTDRARGSHPPRARPGPQASRFASARVTQIAPKRKAEGLTFTRTP